MSKLELNFYGFNVTINSNEDEVIKKLEKDFSYFKKLENDKILKNMNLDISWVAKLEYQIPKGIKSISQTDNSITYDLGSIRYNDYYGKLYSIFNYKTESAKVISDNPDHLHEISYLLILSRMNRFHDLQGLHKIHAMSLSDSDRNVVVMLPMKGGKTTLFLDMLKSKELMMISDDSPIVDIKGDIYPFPTRVGIDFEYDTGEIKEEYVYKINRMKYGEKKLIDIEGLEYKIDKAPERKKNILVLGKRVTGEECRVLKVSKLKMIKPLIQNMVIGIGLPMIIEYFLKVSLKDLIENIYITISRTISAINLVRRSESYIAYLGSDKDLNKQKMLELFL